MARRICSGFYRGAAMAQQFCFKGRGGGARLLELVSEIVTDEIKAVEDLVRK